MSGRQWSHFTGASGEYHVASYLAYRGLHVGMVREGGSAIDLFVSLPSGSRSAVVQVKTTEEARRIRKKDGVLTQYQWACGQKVMHVDPDLIYVFVNMKHGDGVPDSFIVRAAYLHEHFRRLMSENPEKDWSKDMLRLHIEPEAMRPFENEWSPLLKALNLSAFPREA